MRRQIVPNRRRHTSQPFPSRSGSVSDIVNARERVVVVEERLEIGPAAMLNAVAEPTRQRRNSFIDDGSGVESGNTDGAARRDDHDTRAVGAFRREVCNNEEKSRGLAAREACALSTAEPVRK